MRSVPLCVLSFIILSSPSPAQDRRPSFPEINGWTRMPETQFYTPDNLWDLIDGAAEVFLSYGFVDLRLAEYRNADSTDVRVELYRHRSPLDAFGMYAQERAADYRFIDAGIQGYIEEGVLNFLSGCYYVKLTTHREGKAGEDAMRAIAFPVDDALGQPKAWPSALSLFPGDGKMPNAETYIAENFLGHQALRAAFVVPYRTEASFTLFLLLPDSAADTQGMLRKVFGTAEQPLKVPEDGVIATTDPHNGPLLLMAGRNHICGAMNYTDRSAAERQLKVLHAAVTRGKN